MKRTMLAALLAFTLAPGLALADVTTRRAAPDARCTAPSGKKSDKLIEKYGGGLGGEETRKSWKKLLDAGAAGCALVSEWLAAGGEGEELAGHRDAAALLIVSGDEAQVNLGARWLMGHDAATTLQIVGALEKRLASLDEEQSAFLASHEDKKVRDESLGLLMGYHSEGVVVAKRYGPVTVMEYEETVWAGSPDGPAPHHVAAVQAILDAGDHDTAEKVSKFGSRFYKERFANHDAWADFTVEMVAVEPGDKDHQKAANIAARLTAHGEGPRLGEMLDRVLASGNEETLEHMLDGFEDGIKAGIATKATLGHLEAIAAGGSGKQHKRAGAIAKKAGKKLG